MTSPQQNSGGPEYMGSPAAGVVHQRRKWGRPSHGHDPPGQVWPPASPGRRLCCAGTPRRELLSYDGPRKWRGVPKIYEGGRPMNAPRTGGLLSQPWSNNACRGYVIYAMEHCGFSPVTSGAWWQSSMRSLTSVGWRRPSSTLRTAPTNSRQLVPQWSKAEGRHPGGAAFLRFPTGQRGG